MVLATAWAVQNFPRTPLANNTIGCDPVLLREVSFGNKG